MIQPCRSSRASSRSALQALLWAAALLLAPACVTRTLSVTSAPAGARVTIDGTSVGTTPYEQVFESYGERSLDLELAGYVSRHELLPMPAPWWQVFPLDFVTDLLLPLGLHDDHSFHYVLVPRDPEAGTWEQARQAYAREQAALAETRRAAAEHEAGKPDTTPPAAGDEP